MKRTLPSEVEARAKSYGASGAEWLAGLPALLEKLEMQWKIQIGTAIPGGTHAYVALAERQDGSQCIVKIDMPEDDGGVGFQRECAALRLAQGRGYASLYAYGPEHRSYLLERLGKPLKALDYPAGKQLEVLCQTLKESWTVPMDEAKSALCDGRESIRWFRDFISEGWRLLQRPSSEKVIERAMDFLEAREAALRPAEWVLVHGDAHSLNLLQDPARPGSFKFVDPDGLYYEKAYDLGVLMREWQEEYRENAAKAGAARCEMLHQLTGVEPAGIWQWGYLQTVSTAFVLLQIGSEKLGKRMLETAERWLAVRQTD